MPKYIFNNPTLPTSDVTLTYPTSSGTFALVGQGGFSVNNASGSRLIVSDGTSTAATASINLTLTSGILTISSSTAGLLNRNLNLINNSTGNVTRSFGVGIDFESETSTAENTSVGYLDYYWTDHTNANQWGQTEISLKRSGGGPQRSHLLAPGVIGSFYSPQFVPATNAQVGDFNGSYPEYKIHASGSTTDTNQRSLTFALPNAPQVLIIPNDTTWMFSAYVVARRQDADNESAAFWIEGAIFNNNNNITSLDQPTVRQIFAPTAGQDWVATVGVNGGLVINVQNPFETLKTIYWNAVIKIIQVSG